MNKKQSEKFNWGVAKSGQRQQVLNLSIRRFKSYLPSHNNYVKNREKRLAQSRVYKVDDNKRSYMNLTNKQLQEAIEKTIGFLRQTHHSEKRFDELHIHLTALLAVQKHRAEKVVTETDMATWI